MFHNATFFRPPINPTFINHLHPQFKIIFVYEVILNSSTGNNFSFTSPYYMYSPPSCGTLIHGFVLQTSECLFQLLDRMVITRRVKYGNQAVFTE